MSLLKPPRKSQVPQDDDDDEVIIVNSDDGLAAGVIRPAPSTSFCRRLLCGDGSKNAALIRLFAVLILALVINIVMTLSSSSDADNGKPPFSQGASERINNNRISVKLNNATIPAWKPLPAPEMTITKVAFGSCSSQEMPQPYWDTIANAFEPDLFLLMGDNVYGDCEENTCWTLREAYRKMSEHPSVQGGAEKLSVMATLDDHDYGQADCHADNPFKDLAKDLFVEFFDISIQELPAANKNDGVYRSAIWGKSGVGKRLQVILLDTRYSRSPFTTTGIQNSPYTPPPPNTSGQQQMLSERQWSWLEQQLDLPADLRLIVSSIQVLNDVTGFEAWRHLPTERDRFFNLIRDKRVILLTGDRHFGGLYESSSSNDNNGLFKEVTASSFTHTIPLGTFDNCTAPTDCDEDDASRIGDAVRENHFGSIEIDWQNETVRVALRRAESSYGSTYTKTYPKQGKFSDAGEILVSKRYLFSEL